MLKTQTYNNLQTLCNISSVSDVVFNSVFNSESDFESNLNIPNIYNFNNNEYGSSWEIQ